MHTLALRKIFGELKNGGNFLIKSYRPTKNQFIFVQFPGHFSNPPNILHKPLRL